MSEVEQKQHDSNDQQKINNIFGAPCPGCRGPSNYALTNNALNGTVSFHRPQLIIYICVAYCMSHAYLIKKL